MKKRLKQAEKERIAKGFICHLCGAVMGRASKYYHLRTFHQGGVLERVNLTYLPKPKTSHINSDED